MRKSKFERVLGKSNVLRVLDYLLDLNEDESVINIAQGTDLTRKTVDKIIASFLVYQIIMKTRIIGKTQMFQLNKDDLIVQKIYEISGIVLKKLEDKSE